MCGSAEDADPAAGVFDHREYLQAGAVQGEGFEEVAVPISVNSLTASGLSSVQPFKTGISWQSRTSPSTTCASSISPRTPARSWAATLCGWSGNAIPSSWRTRRPELTN